MSLYYVDTKNRELAINSSQIEMIYVNQMSIQCPSPVKEHVSIIEHTVSVRVRFSSGNEISIQEYKCNNSKEIDSLLKKANEYISCIVESINNFEVKFSDPIRSNKKYLAEFKMNRR